MSTGSCTWVTLKNSILHGDGSCDDVFCLLPYDVEMPCA